MNSYNEKKISWKKLLNTGRFRGISSTVRDQSDNRTEFDNDYSRIIFSSAFRRLQDKAQVFPLDSNDFIRTRLTHSLEVSTIAESIGVSIEEYLINEPGITDYDKEMRGQLSRVLACVGLLHDIGNTPFGHFGEFAIQEFFKKFFENGFKNIGNLFEGLDSENLEKLKVDLEEIKNNKEYINDFNYFDGNAQAFRVIGTLQSMQKFGGLNLTYATLSALIKYPRSSTKGNKINEDKKKNKLVSYKKYGYLQSEEVLFKRVVNETGLSYKEHDVMRNPIVYILEAADDIAYSASDIEDGIKKGLLNIEYLKEEIFEFLKERKVLEDERELFDGNDKNTYENLKDEEKVLFCHLNKRDRNLMRAVYCKIEYGDKNNEYTMSQVLRVAIQGYMISSVIEEFKKSYELIMNGEYELELLNQSEAGKLRERLKKMTEEKIFNSKEILKNEIAGDKVVSKLLEIFVEGVLCKDYKNNKKSQRIYELISDNYKGIYENETKKNMYSKLQLVVDFISGMTDDYALDLYKHLQGVII